MDQAQSEMNILSNGKSYNLGDDVDVPMKTSLDDDQNGTQPVRFDDPDGGMENEEFLPGADGKKPVRFTDFEGKTSFGMSVFNLGNAIMGSGILGLAYAMANTGILLFFLWYLNGNYLVIMVSASVILPLALMKQLGYLGYTSGFSLSCMVFFLTAVIYKKFQIPCHFEEFNSLNHTTAQPSLNVSNHVGDHLLTREEDDALCAPRMFTLNSQTAYTIPILAFAFVCHPEVLPIYTELRNPTKKRMQKVSNISIFVMYTMYFLAALFGYLTFYGNKRRDLDLNIVMENCSIPMLSFHLPGTHLFFF